MVCSMAVWWTPQCLHLASPRVPRVMPIAAAECVCLHPFRYTHWPRPNHWACQGACCLCNSSLRYLGKLTGFQLQQSFYTFARRERNRMIFLKVRISCEYELQPLVARASRTQLPILDTRIPSIVSRPSFWVEDQWDFILGQQKFPTERVDSWIHSNERESWRVKKVW